MPPHQRRFEVRILEKQLATVARTIDQKARKVKHVVVSGRHVITVPWQKLIWCELSDGTNSFKYLRAENRQRFSPLCRATPFGSLYKAPRSNRMRRQHSRLVCKYFIGRMPNCSPFFRDIFLSQTPRRPEQGRRHIENGMPSPPSPPRGPLHRPHKYFQWNVFNYFK